MTQPELLTIKDHGPIWELKPPHTVASVRAEAGERPRRGLCRLKHNWEVIGTTYFGRDDSIEDLTTTVLSIISTKVWRELVRCKRCHQISMRGG